MRILPRVPALPARRLFAVAEGGRSRLLGGTRAVLRWFAEREVRMVAAITVALSGFALVPPSPPDVPERIVNVPGLGWVDAEATPGVPASARDGEVLILAAVRSTFADPDILDASGATPSPAAVAEVAAAEASPDRPDGAAFGAPVSINGGSLAQLDSLPGIGPALAKRIVAARPFRSIGELDRVKGIGPKTVAKLRPFVAL